MPTTHTLEAVPEHATAVAELRDGLPSWLALPLSERIHLLHRLRRRLDAQAQDIVDAYRQAHPVDPSGPWAIEPWTSVATMAAPMRALERVLRQVAAGQDPLPNRAIQHRPDGGLTVDVYPTTLDERLLFSDYQAQAWLQPGTTPTKVRSGASEVYRDGDYPAPGVALLLAAGNVPSLLVTDLLHLLFEQGCVVAAKMNPVLAYLRPHMETLFGELIDRGWLRFVDEDPAVGGYLATHEYVDRIHMTGSAATYNTLMWGARDPEAREPAHAPRLAKPFTAELGGVSPLIVVPGPWTAKDIRRQADLITTTALFNCGHICASTQVLLLPDGWDATDALVSEIRSLMASAEARPPYYPHSDSRIQRVLSAHPDAEVLHAPHHRVLVSDLSHEQDSTLFRDEAFTDVLAVVRLPAPSLDTYLTGAVRFANTRLAGSLSATLLIDPHTATRAAPSLDQTLETLQYGTIGINEWPVASFLFGTAPWGAHPGHTPESIGSGIGTVLNPLQLPAWEKTIVRGVFRPRVRPPSSLHARNGAAVYQHTARYLTSDSPRHIPRMLLAALRA